MLKPLEACGEVLLMASGAINCLIILSETAPVTGSYDFPIRYVFLDCCMSDHQPYPLAIETHRTLLSPASMSYVETSNHHTSLKHITQMTDHGKVGGTHVAENDRAKFETFVWWCLR
jgi:hypothetical protein